MFSALPFAGRINMFVIADLASYVLCKLSLTNTKIDTLIVCEACTLLLGVKDSIKEPTARIATYNP